MKSLICLFAAAVSFGLVLPLTAGQNSDQPGNAAGTVTGKWHFVFQTDGGERIFDPVLQQDGQNVSGKWDKADVKGTFTDGKLTLEFPVNSEEAGPGTLKIKGTLANDVLTGTWSFNDYDGSFKATRGKTGDAAPSEH